MARVRLWGVVLVAVVGIDIAWRLFRTGEPLARIALALVVAGLAGALVFAGVRWIDERSAWDPSQALLTAFLVGGILAWGVGNWLWTAIAVGMDPWSTWLWLTFALNGGGGAMLLLAIETRSEMSD